MRFIISIGFYIAELGTRNGIGIVVCKVWGFQRVPVPCPHNQHNRVLVPMLGSPIHGNGQLSGYYVGH